MLKRITYNSLSHWWISSGVTHIQFHESANLITVLLFWPLQEENNINIWTSTDQPKPDIICKASPRLTPPAFKNHRGVVLIIGLNKKIRLFSWVLVLSSETPSSFYKRSAMSNNNTTRWRIRLGWNTLGDEYILSHFSSCSVIRPFDIQSSVSSLNQFRWHSCTSVGITLTQSVLVKELKLTLQTALVNESMQLWFNLIHALLEKPQLCRSQQENRWLESPSQGQGRSKQTLATS